MPRAGESGARFTGRCSGLLGRRPAGERGRRGGRGGGAGEGPAPADSAARWPTHPRAQRLALAHDVRLVPRPPPRPARPSPRTWPQAPGERDRSPGAAGGGGRLVPGRRVWASPGTKVEPSYPGTTCRLYLFRQGVSHVRTAVTREVMIISDAAKARPGSMEAPHDMHGMPESTTTKTEQPPDIEGPSDLLHYDAFISYSHQDRLIRAEATCRASRAWEARMAGRTGIRPAEQWEPALYRAIEGSDTSSS